MGHTRGEPRDPGEGCSAPVGPSRLPGRAERARRLQALAGAHAKGLHPRQRPANPDRSCRRRRAEGRRAPKRQERLQSGCRPGLVGCVQKRLRWLRKRRPQRGGAGSRHQRQAAFTRCSRACGPAPVGRDRGRTTTAVCKAVGLQRPRPVQVRGATPVGRTEPPPTVHGRTLETSSGRCGARPSVAPPPCHAPAPARKTDRYRRRNRRHRLARRNQVAQPAGLATLRSGIRASRAGCLGRAYSTTGSGSSRMPKRP